MLHSPPIFISYRRDDGPETAQLFAEHLKKNFGESSVFLDTSRLNPGSNFPSELENAVRGAKIVLAMIGPNWKGADPTRNRLMEEEDWVRKELEFALGNKGSKVFPVFVNGATAKESFINLPPNLSGISIPHGIPLRKLEFEKDILPLIEQVSLDLNLENPLKDHPFKEGKYKLPTIPFKGMDFFTENDARIFFGRGEETRRLINNLIHSQSQILLFFGYSGVGKSSILFAGLKPRLEFKGWGIFYFRRDAERNFKDVLENADAESGNQLIILDQLEEIFTNPKSNISADAEKRELRQLVNSLIQKKERKVLLSFRKEYLAEIKALFKEQVFEEEFLESLNAKGILEAIEGLNQSESGRDYYQLEYEEKSDGQKLSTVIGQTIMGDAAGNKAPLLQLILRKMWDKVSLKKPRKFTFSQFEEFKSNNLPELVQEQLDSLKSAFDVELDSGLILELLFYFTTVRGTSAQHSFLDVQRDFQDVRLKTILDALKNVYLITEVPSGNESEADIFRLAHDSLAPIIREMHELSDLPGQKASRMLNSRKREIDDLETVEFTKTDLNILDAGRSGMRTWSDAENKLILDQKEKVKKEKRKQKGILIGIIGLILIFYDYPQSCQYG